MPECTTAVWLVAKKGEHDLPVHVARSLLRLYLPIRRSNALEHFRQPPIMLCLDYLRLKLLLPLPSWSMESNSSCVSRIVVHVVDGTEEDDDGALEEVGGTTTSQNGHAVDRGCFPLCSLSSPLSHAWRWSTSSL